LPFVERGDGVDVQIHAKSVAELIGDIELQAERHPKFQNSRGRDAMKGFQPASCSTNHNVSYPARRFSLK